MGLLSAVASQLRLPVHALVDIMIILGRTLHCILWCWVQGMGDRRAQELM